MSKGGVTPSTPVVGWMFFRRHRQEGFTLRWRRGDRVAYVLNGKNLSDYSMANVLDTIPVVPTGWTDLNDIRKLGQRWLREQ